MKANMYLVPVQVQGQVVGLIETFIPDLSLLISEMGCHVLDADQVNNRYSNPEQTHISAVGEIEIPSEMEANFRDLKDCLTEEAIFIDRVFSYLSPILESKVKEIQSQPKIVVPDAMESKLILDA